MDKFQSKLMAISVLVLVCFPTMSFSIPCAIPRKMVARVETAGFVCRSPTEPVPREQRGYSQGSRTGNGPPSPTPNPTKRQDGFAAPPENKQ
ncbi:hypothetical protein DsansV1_C38g0233481 [Dioscorea sansibarensis]